MSLNSGFTQKNIPLALIRFAVPGVITILMAELYNMVDTFFVGFYAGASHQGASAIGALGIAFPVQRLIIALSLMIGVGSATAVSRALGEKNNKNISANIGASLSLGFVVLALVPLFFYLFSAQILNMLGARGEILKQSKSYLDIIVAGTFFLGFTNIFGYQMTALGHPGITLIATSIGALTNIAADYLLVGKYGMGVRGAAAATLFSQFCALLYTLYKVRIYRRLHGFLLKPVCNLRLMRIILAVGFATFIVEISDAVLIAALNNILLPVGGNDAVIIIGVITRVSMFMYIMIIGISAGMQPLAAYSYGAGDYPRVKKIVKITSLMVLLSSALLWATFLLFTGQIIGSFMKNPELLEETVSVFRFTIMIFPVISFYYVCIYYCQSVGKAGLGFFLSVYRQLLLFIPLLYILSKIFGMQGAWMTYPVTDFLAALSGSYFLWKNMRGLEEKKG